MASNKRDAILEAALPLAGAGEFSIEDLLRSAGAGIGTFYHHFPNGREDLLAALRDRAASEYEAAVARVFERNRDAQGGVRALVHHHARWAGENRDLARLLPLAPGAGLLRAARAWLRSVGLGSVSAEELLALTVAAARVAPSPDRLAAAAWAAVVALEG